MTHRKDGLWQETIILDGKRKYFYGKSKAEVLRKINEFQQRERDGVSFAFVADLWDTAHREAVSYNAHRAYSVPYKTTLDWFGERPINAITAQEIDTYIKAITAQKFAKRTVKGYLSLLNMIFEYGTLHGYCNGNPAAVVSVPRNLPVQHRELPETGEVDKIKHCVDEPFGLFAYFLLYTGCRRGEALALRYEDIDRENKTITINKSLYWMGNTPAIKSTKTKAGERTIILLDALMEHLPSGSGYVFGGDHPLTSTAFRRRWEKYKKISGIEFTPHQLRHLFATILFECNIDETVAKELMGHSSINVTRNIYTHIRKKKLEDAAKALNNFAL